MYEAWFDASVRRRRTSVGGVIMKDGVIIESFTKEIRHRRSSCSAEYVAFIELMLRIQRLGIEEVNIYGDAMVIVTQVKQTTQVSQDRPLYKYHRNAVKLLEQIPSWRMKWVPRRENKLADKLSRSLDGVPA